MGDFSALDETIKTGIQFVGVAAGVGLGWYLKERRTRQDTIQQARAEWAAAMKACLYAARRSSFAAKGYVTAASRKIDAPEFQKDVDHWREFSDAARRTLEETHEQVHLRAVRLRLLTDADQLNVKALSEEALGFHPAEISPSLKDAVLDLQDRVDKQVDAWATATWIHW
jgi:hypothetical protein